MDHRDSRDRIRQWIEASILPEEIRQFPSKEALRPPPWKDSVRYRREGVKEQPQAAPVEEGPECEILGSNIVINSVNAIHMHAKNAIEFASESLLALFPIEHGNAEKKTAHESDLISFVPFEQYQKSLLAKDFTND
jgi:hypothetical protein